ncbi:MAG: FG-GAP-like repeat-containing protein, partial [Chloroflexota bacterium]
MLKIETNVVPDVFRRAYGVTLIQQGGKDYMYVDLAPVSENGQITAFYGKVAYRQSDLNDINWSKVELVWTAFMKHSPASDPSNSGYLTVPVAEYIEPSFRFAGLEVSKSSTTKYAVIGTPNAQTDHRQLVNLVAGLEGSFLSSFSSDFDTIVNRLSTPTTSITDTWGVPVSEIAVGLPTVQPAHADLMLMAPLDTNSTITQFLATNSYDTAQSASLLMAIEGLYGTDGLDGEGVISGNTFTFNLAKIPLYTTRTMTMSHYEHNGTRWTDEDELTAINRLVANYPGDPAAAVTTLQQSYPEITEFELATMLLAFYMLWTNGRSATVSVDGVDIIGEAETAQELQNRVGLPAITDTLVYLIEAYNMGDPLGSVVWKDPQTYFQFINDPVSTRWYAVTALSAISLTILAKISLGIRNVARGTFSLGFRSIKLIGTSYGKAARVVIGYEKVLGFGRGVAIKGGKKITTYTLRTTTKSGWFGLKMFKVSAKLAKYYKLVGRIARVASAAAAVISITTAWVTYAKFSSPYEYERQYAAVYASVQTFLAIVYFVLALTGIGTILVAIFTLIDIIGWIASSASKYEPVESVITTTFAKLILDVDALTKPYDTSYRGLDGLVDGNGYTVAGSTLTLIDRFFGTVQGYRNHYDSNGQHPYLNSSDIYSILEARAANNITVVPGHDATNRSNRCEIVNALKICANNLWADFTFANEGLNQQVEVFYRITAVTQYSQRSLAGLINKTKTNTLNMPEELEGVSWSWLPIKVDVLPNTLNGLLAWPAVTNHDDDGDDISDTIENGLTGVAADIDGDSVPNSQDWDRDGDGLGDGYETANQNALGTNPNLLDSDSDGLNDKVEIENGTLVNLADSDSDGLNDAVETYRWTGSQWTGGGWTINILGNDYWVFSDPDVSDADRDGIIDSSERANGTSPYAFNDAPEILLDAGPVVTTPSNSFGVYVKAGDTVTSSLKIFNTGTSAISDTLTYCLPSVLAGATLTVTGDVTPATQQSSGCYSWDFSSTNLGLFQRFNVDIAGSATSTTVNESISVSLPYAVNGAAQPISYTIPYVQDNSPPTVQITNPLSNTLLTSQFYVIGGFAQDSSSWIDRVEVTVPGTSGQAVLSDSAWAYTWQLPTDGPATVTATAYDALGNSSGPVSVPVTVDTLPPTLNVNIADRATIGSTTAFSPTLQLNGTATDNFSGVDRIQLQTNDRPWITVWDGTTNLLNTSWSGIWELPTVENAQGEHLLSLRAFDAYGNVTTITRTVFIDILPPTNGLTNQAFVQETPNHVPGGQTVPLYGVASDAGNNPLPADPIALSGSLDSISDATVWLGLDKLTDNDRGATVTWLGDMNGDRLGDLAVGLPGANGGRGKVIVVNGRPGNWPAPNAGEIEPLSTNSPSYLGGTGDQLGSIIHSAGDVNGDGLDDLLVGDPVNNRITLVLGRQNNYIFEQPLDGSANNQIGIVTQASGESLSTLQATGVAGVGDVTNDGYGDLLVAVSTANGSRVYLLPGTISLINDQALDFHGAATLDTTSTNVSVAGVGDINSDLIPDFAIAIDGTIHLFAGGGGWVQGGLTPLNTSAAIATYSSSDSVPTIVAAGDINGDRIADFAFTNGSTPTIVFGNASQSFTTQSLSGFASPLSGFLAAVGDVNKDGRGDLLVGNSNGDAYLISGSNLSAAAATISGVTAAASTPFITAADLAGDGSSDLALVPSAANITGLGFNGFANLETQAPFISTSALKQINGGAQITTTAQSPILEPGDVTVGLVGANYTSIQAAIDSGATRVLVQPGIYSEAITLTAGVTIIGSGPDRTVLQFPTGSSASSLVTANNVANAAVQNMTLLGSSGGSGSGSQTGLAVSNGATGVVVEPLTLTAVFIFWMTVRSRPMPVAPLLTARPVWLPLPLTLPL